MSDATVHHVICTDCRRPFLTGERRNVNYDQEPPRLVHAPGVCAARLLGELEKAEDYEDGLRLRLRDATAVVRAAKDVLRQDDEVDPSAKSLLDLSWLRSAVAAFDEGRSA